MFSVLESPLKTGFINLSLAEFEVALRFVLCDVKFKVSIQHWSE